MAIVRLSLSRRVVAASNTSSHESNACETCRLRSRLRERFRTRSRCTEASIQACQLEKALDMRVLRARRMQ